MNFKEQVQKLNATQAKEVIKKKGLLQLKNEWSGKEFSVRLDETGDILQTVDKTLVINLNDVNVIREKFISINDYIYEVLNWEQLVNAGVEN